MLELRKHSLKESNLALSTLLLKNGFRRPVKGTGGKCRGYYLKGPHDLRVSQAPNASFKEDMR